jgi:hypothetical protein
MQGNPKKMGKDYRLQEIGGAQLAHMVGQKDIQYKRRQHEKKLGMSDIKKDLELPTNLEESIDRFEFYFKNLNVIKKSITCTQRIVDEEQHKFQKKVSFI